MLVQAAQPLAGLERLFDPPTAPGHLHHRPALAEPTTSVNTLSNGEHHEVRLAGNLA
jgi:hypothetical protein